MPLPTHLMPVILRSVEYERAYYFWIAPSGVALTDVLDPNFWANVAPRLKLYDRIEVVAADRSFDVDLRVVAIDPRGYWAAVHMLRGPEDVAPVPAPAQAAPDSSGYMIENDAVQGWRILNGRDLIAHGLASEDAAKAKLAEIKAPKPAKKPG